MATVETKLPLSHATRLANRLVQLLSPHCNRIDIAGSIRRGKEEVSDIEIVCEPKKIEADFLGFSKKPVLEFWAVLRQFSRVMGKEDGTGRYYKCQIPTGWSKPEYIQLDLFIPQPEDYYRQLAIRTGSANYAITVIAEGWRKQGWAGTPSGLRREEEVEKHGDNWVCRENNPTLPPEWQSEQEFFEFINVPYLDPKQRK